MRIRSLVLAATAGAMLPAAVSAQGDIIAQLFEKAAAIYKDKGYAPTGTDQRGELGEGAETRLTIKATGGTAFSVVGVCDLDCGNLDIRLLGIDGSEVAKDVEDDDFPIVNFEKPGTYTVRVTMVKCKSSPCAFGIKAFKQ